MQEKMRKIYWFNIYYELTAITFIIEMNKRDKTISIMKLKVRQHHKKRDSVPSTFARFGIPLPLIIITISLQPCRPLRQFQ